MEVYVVITYSAASQRASYAKYIFPNGEAICSRNV